MLDWNSEVGAAQYGLQSGVAISQALSIERFGIEKLNR